MGRGEIEGAVDRLRYISLVATIASGLGSIRMFLIGAIKTGLAYQAYFVAPTFRGGRGLNGLSLNYKTAVIPIGGIRVVALPLPVMCE